MHVAKLCIADVYVRKKEIESFKLPESELERIHQLFNIYMYSF